VAGFVQKRFPNGTFASVDPADCSANDPQPNTRQCSLQSDNTVGFYESLSWEYSWFAPHDTAYLITLMGGNVSDSVSPAPVPLSVTLNDTDNSSFSTLAGDFHQTTESLF
jgi:hypothetical protein